MEVDRFCDMIPINKRSMRRSWFFISYSASDDLDLPPQATHMVWRREKRTTDDTAPMIVGLVLFERTVRENRLVNIPGIYSAGPTKSFKHGFTYFTSFTWKVASQVHVLGPIEELNLEIPFYHNLRIPEQEAEEDIKKLLKLVEQANSIMDVYRMEPTKALKWHSFLQLAFEEKAQKKSSYRTRLSIRKRKL